MTARQPSLTVFYDQLCPLCNRTVLILNHFDLFSRIEFKNAQQHAANYPALTAISPETLLTDLYALDVKSKRVYSGLETYIQNFLEDDLFSADWNAIKPAGYPLFCNPKIPRHCRFTHSHVLHS